MGGLRRGDVGYTDEDAKFCITIGKERDMIIDEQGDRCWADRRSL